MVYVLIFIYLVLVFANFNHSLQELRKANSNEILVTASIIRDTTNNLFRTLQLNTSKESPRLTEYTILHKYFEALTLQDYETLNEILQRTTVYDENINNIADLVVVINDLLEENNSEVNDGLEINSNDLNVINYIETFLHNLQRLKEALSVDNVYVTINKDVLELLKEKNIKNTNDTNTESTANKSDESDVVDENEFWQPSGRRIFKGTRTKIRHFPFMATIQIFNNFHCAGSIIKSDLIITASSCLQLAWNNRFYRENPAFLSVRVGSSFYNGGGEVIPVLEIYFHPGYNPKNLRNNICILRLSRKLKFRRTSRRLKKIDFDRRDSNLPLTTYGITVVGWGAKEHSSVIGNPWKNILSYAVLDVYPIRDCQDIYSREYVTTKNFCAGFISRGGGACNRDVGGPGIVEGKLMGVVSFGSPVCGMSDAPTVFTKVGYYTDWIEQIMEQKVPVSKKKTTAKPINEPYINIAYEATESTTFKIPPLTGETMSPIPISQIDSQLRIIDEDVFKDFLATMFNSKEVKDYKDMLLDYANKTANDNQNNEIIEEFQPVTESTDVYESNTVLTNGSPEHRSAENNNVDTAYTLMDQNIPFNKKEEAQYINEVELKEIEKEISSSVKYEDYSSKEEEKEVILDDVKDNGLDKDKDDEGMSIPNDIFKDMTRTNNKNNDVLPENVLYELLSEVIREEVENIGRNTLRSF